MYQLCMFEHKRNIHDINIVNYMVFAGDNFFSFDNYTLIIGPNGSGKTALANALMISAGVDSLRWYDLSLFTSGKEISVTGTFSTGYGKRIRNYRDAPRCYFGTDKHMMKKMDLKTYKKCAGLYECQRSLFYVLSKDFVNKLSPNQRYRNILRLSNRFGIDVTSLITKANSYMSNEYLDFHIRFSMDDSGFHILRNDMEHPSYSSGLTAVIRAVLILAAAEQVDSPPVVFDDNFGLYALDRSNSKAFAQICKEYKGQIFVFEADSAQTFISTARALGYKIIDLENPGNDMELVSKKIKTRNYVKHMDLRLEKKIELSNEIIFEALKGKSNPIAAWSGGQDSTVIVDLLIRSGLLKPVRLMRSNTRNEFPESYRYNKIMEHHWGDLVSYDVPVYRNGEWAGAYEKGLVSAEMSIWEVIEKFGFPLLPKDFRRSNYPYYDAVMKYCKICINECCKFLKENPSKTLYKNTGVDLVFRGMTGGESLNRKRQIALNGYTRYVKSYGTTICDAIGFWSKKDVIEYHLMRGIPWCEAYDKGFTRLGCFICGKSILTNGDDSNMKLLRMHYSPIFHHVMVKLGLAKEIMKLQYIVKKARALGLVAGGPQLELDDLDVEYLNHIDSYEEYDLEGIFAHQPCKCDCV